MTESFGFEQEIAIFLTGSAKMEPRVMQAIHQVLSEGGAVGRVDPSVYLIVSQQQNALEWVENYIYQNPQLSFPVVLTTSALNRLLPTNPWTIRNLIGEQLYFRDLFDYQLPIHNDLEFFGRRALIAGIVDSVRKGRNTGLFGLRKTGKSSVLEKVRRTLNTTRLAHVLFYDCKLPSVRELKANEFLRRILTDLYQSAGRSLDKALVQRHPSDAFVQGCAQISKKQPVCIMFDEVEYISPLTPFPSDAHWKTDFIPFWQTLWAAQSQPSSRLSLVIAGVNPTVAEVDSFKGVQNPMFGIIRPTYIKGLEDEAMGNMIQFFGTRMGLHFTQNAIDYLINRYGGHPSLTRRACSYVHSSVATRELERPTLITEEMIRRDEELRDAELTFYCRHIVSELNDFYPAEYEMLEMLSTANTVEFMELQRDPELVRHITEYGLVRLVEGVRPKFQIPVVGRYIASERARRYGVRLRQR
jgi:hypothetical protein